MAYIADGYFCCHQPEDDFLKNHPRGDSQKSTNPHNVAIKLPGNVSIHIGQVMNVILTGNQISGKFKDRTFEATSRLSEGKEAAAQLGRCTFFVFAAE